MRHNELWSNGYLSDMSSRHDEKSEENDSCSYRSRNDIFYVYLLNLHTREDNSV